MKVFIGKYKSWIGPHQIAKKILFWKKDNLDDDIVYAFGEWLSKNRHGNDSWLMKLCKWIYSKQQRTIKVKLHDYDTWNIDTTLAVIILPLLKKYKEEHHGSPSVDNDDVPEHLRRKVPFDYDIDVHWHDRWEWVLGEMIFAFESHANDLEGNFLKNFDSIGYQAMKDRINNGLRLFGKYYTCLWV